MKNVVLKGLQERQSVKNVMDISQRILLDGPEGEDCK